MRTHTHTYKHAPFLRPHTNTLLDPAIHFIFDSLCGDDKLQTWKESSELRGEPFSRSISLAVLLLLRLPPFLFFFHPFFFPSTFSALFSLTLFMFGWLCSFYPPRSTSVSSTLFLAVLLDSGCFHLMTRRWRSGGLNAEPSFKGLESNTHIHKHTQHTHSRHSCLYSYNLFSEDLCSSQKQKAQPSENSPSAASTSDPL